MIHEVGESERAQTSLGQKPSLHPLDTREREREWPKCWGTFRNVWHTEFVLVLLPFSWLLRVDPSHLISLARFRESMMYVHKDAFMSRTSSQTGHPPSKNWSCLGWEEMMQPSGHENYQKVIETMLLFLNCCPITSKTMSRGNFEITRLEVISH